MDTSLFKRMGVHDGKVVNEHLYGMPPHWKTESGKDNTRGHSDKTCIEHGTVKDKPNRPYYAEGGEVSRKKAGAAGSIFRKKLAVGAVAKIRKDQY